jgi:hypothetical protein
MLKGRSEFAGWKLIDFMSVMRKQAGITNTLLLPYNRFIPLISKQKYESGLPQEE